MPVISRGRVLAAALALLLPAALPAQQDGGDGSCGTGREGTAGPGQGHSSMGSAGPKSFSDQLVGRPY